MRPSSVPATKIAARHPGCPSEAHFHGMTHDHREPRHSCHQQDEAIPTASSGRRRPQPTPAARTSASTKRLPSSMPLSLRSNALATLRASAFASAACRQVRLVGAGRPFCRLDHACATSWPAELLTMPFCTRNS